MKVILIILITLAWQAGYSASAQRAKPKEVATSINPAEQKAIEISVSENRIHVENAPAGSSLEIYSVVGIRVAEIQLKQPSGDYTVNIAKGYYIIRIGETVRKIAIR